MDDHNVAIGFYPQGGDDPAPTAPTHTVTEERWAMWSPDGQCLIGVNGDTLLWHSQADAEADRLGDHFPICVRVTLTYEVPQ